MKITFEYLNKNFSADLSKPIDISISHSENSVNAFHLPHLQRKPFSAGSFTGDVNKGGSCNVNDICFNPHGNGTHTECIGHITEEKESVNQILKEYFFLAQLISVKPSVISNDSVITPNDFNLKAKFPLVPAIILRTLPNLKEKKNKNYSGTNPPYVSPELAEFLAQQNVQHLLIDLPSVDKEDDEGKLLAHRAFWSSGREHCTITELIFVPDEIADGTYLLNLQVAPIENDASPARPVLFSLE